MNAHTSHVAKLQAANCVETYWHEFEGTGLQDGLRKHARRLVDEGIPGPDFGEWTAYLFQAVEIEQTRREVAKDKNPL